MSASPIATTFAPRTFRVQRPLEWLGTGLIALYLVSFAARNASLQWDLRSCLAAARAALGGADPYVLENLGRFSERTVSLPFLYPPVTLLPFLALTPLPAANVAALWIGLKVVLLAVLVLGAWRRDAGAGPLAVALLAVFGWNGAALWDLRAGNVATLECALLWLGFACFARGRRGWFATFVVAAACFKLTPAVYLLLLLAPDRARPARPGLLLLALAALAIVVAGPFLVDPARHWQGFLRNVPSALAAGDANPSGPSMALDLVRAAGLPAARESAAALALWAAFALAVLAASRGWLKAAWQARDAWRWISTAVLLATLLAPRPMAYGYLVLAFVPLERAPAPFHTPVGRWVLVLLLCAQGLARAAAQQPTGWVFTYAPFLLTLGLWILAVRGAGSTARHPALAASHAT